MLSEKDLHSIQSKGIDTEKINLQISNFKNGFPPTQLESAATIENGIVKFSNQKIEKLSTEFKDLIKGKKIVKFVPASGAASRMFKHLFEFKDQYTKENEAELLKDKSFNSVAYFFQNIHKFAFYKDLNEMLGQTGKSIDQLIQEKDYKSILEALLEENGLNYAALPKGLLKFHNYDDHNRMSIEEHLVEGSVYSQDEYKDVRIHFTVSPEHMEKFKEAIRENIHAFETDYDVSLKISFSIQKPSTDIIAVDMNNEPFRNVPQSRFN